MPVTISREQRDALYGEAACEMTGIGDIYHALDHDDPAEARRLRRRYEDVMRLLDDIGWTEEDPRERIPLTMHADQLMRIAHLLGSRALEQMAAHETVIDEERPLRERHALVASTCSDLLEQLTLNSPSSIANA